MLQLNTVHRFAVLWLCCLFLQSFNLNAQTFNDYIDKAWQTNSFLKAKKFDLLAAQQSLDEAKAMYGPSLNFGTLYTLAAGGRDIDFQVGDLLNNVYSTLNDLTQSQDFPQLENQSFNFLPNNFYDARFRITQPIYYPDLAINKQIKRSQIELVAVEIKAFKRSLSRQVMDGIISINKARTAAEIYQHASSLLEEARRATSSMVRNGVALPSSISRIDAEISKVKAKQIESEAMLTQAVDYLTFLVGQPVDTAELFKISLTELPGQTLDQQNIREEIDQLDLAIFMTETGLKKQESFYKPNIGAQLDLGSQDFNFRWNPYAVLGINVSINLFDNKIHQHQKSQAVSKISSLKEQKTYATQQFDLQSKMAKVKLESAIAQASTYDSQIQYAKDLFKNTLSRQAEGSANTLDVIDAQTQVTQSELEKAIARYNAWTAWTEYQYVSASLPIQ